MFHITLGNSRLLKFCQLINVKWLSDSSFHLHFLITRETEHLFRYFLATCVSWLLICLFAHFLLLFSFFSYWRGDILFILNIKFDPLWITYSWSFFNYLCGKYLLPDYSPPLLLSLRCFLMKNVFLNLFYCVFSLFFMVSALCLFFKPFPIPKPGRDSPLFYYIF